MADTTQIRALLVDDEPLARDLIREMLSDDPEALIVAECVNGQEAVAAIHAHTPDVLFLDVQMPELGGFEVLEALKLKRFPHLIFLTAYDQYAVRAFEVHALEYLLKPFDRERFDASWQRAKARVRREKNGKLDQHILALLRELKAGSNYLKRLVVKTNGRVFLLDTEEIDWLEAEGDYVSVHSGPRTHLIRETICNLETQLDPREFLRIDRSAIVRLDRIKELQPWFYDEYRIILYDGTQLTLSRAHRAELQEILGKFSRTAP
jgi:two-component system LytT family response regulator